MNVLKNTLLIGGLIIALPMAQVLSGPVSSKQENVKEEKFYDAYASEEELIEDQFCKTLQIALDEILGEISSRTVMNSEEELYKEITSVIEKNIRDQFQNNTDTLDEKNLSSLADKAGASVRTKITDPLISRKFIEDVVKYTADSTTRYFSIALFLQAIENNVAAALDKIPSTRSGWWWFSSPQKNVSHDEMNKIITNSIRAASGIIKNRNQYMIRDQKGNINTEYISDRAQETIKKIVLQKLDKSHEAIVENNKNLIASEIGNIFKMQNILRSIFFGKKTSQ